MFDVILIQASLETGFSIQRLLRLKDTSDNIFRIERDISSFTETYNEQLLDVIQRFREAHKALITKHPVFHVSYAYVSRADSKKVETEVRLKATALEKELPETLATVSTCDFGFIGARDAHGLVLHHLGSYQRSLDAGGPDWRYPAPGRRSKSWPPDLEQRLRGRVKTCPRQSLLAELGAFGVPCPFGKEGH